MEDHALSDLIDQYLLGTISPEDDQQLQQLISSDPKVEKLVEESKLAYKALEIVRRQQLKAKLKVLDENSSTLGFTFSKWLGLVILLLAGCFFYLYMSSYYFSPDTIARRYYVPFQDKSKVIQATNAQLILWAQADDAFQKGEYQKSILRFATLAENSDPAQASLAQWNLLVTQLAVYGPGPKWKNWLDAFELSAMEPFAQKARDLRSHLDSKSYRFFFFRLQENLSTIKPRLI